MNFRVWLLTAVVAVVLAAAGVVAWRVIPGRSPDATPAAGITGETVTEALLDGAELTKLLDQPFKSTTAAPIYGGVDEMEDPATSDSQCVGVMNVAPRQLYRAANVRSYTRQTWVDATPTEPGPERPRTTVMFVVESVVALPSAADAEALFAQFAEQWRRCDGAAINQGPATPDEQNPPRVPGTEIHISNVRTDDTVLAASVALDKKPKAPDTRAIGLVENCIVGVLIAFTGEDDAAGSGDPETSSTQAVRLMMNKVGALAAAGN